MGREKVKVGRSLVFYSPLSWRGGGAALARMILADAALSREASHHRRTSCLPRRSPIRTPARPPMTPLGRFPRVFARAFSGTPAAAAGSLQTSSSSRKKLQHMLRNVPTYPFPIKHTFKQSWFGLYGGKHIQFGNNVGPKSQFKTRRFWLPNIRHTHLYSNALDMNLNLEVATSVLREFAVLFLPLPPPPPGFGV